MTIHDKTLMQNSTMQCIHYTTLHCIASYMSCSTLQYIAYLINIYLYDLHARLETEQPANITSVQLSKEMPIKGLANERCNIQRYKKGMHCKRWRFCIANVRCKLSQNVRPGYQAHRGLAPRQQHLERKTKEESWRTSLSIVTYLIIIRK